MHSIPLIRDLIAKYTATGYTYIYKLIKNSPARFLFRNKGFHVRTEFKRTRFSAEAFAHKPLEEYANSRFSADSVANFPREKENQPSLLSRICRSRGIAFTVALGYIIYPRSRVVAMILAPLANTKLFLYYYFSLVLKIYVKLYAVVFKNINSFTFDKENIFF